MKNKTGLENKSTVYQNNNIVSVPLFDNKSIHVSFVNKVNNAAAVTTTPAEGWGSEWGSNWGSS